MSETKPVPKRDELLVIVEKLARKTHLTAAERETLGTALIPLVRSVVKKTEVRP